MAMAQVKYECLDETLQMQGNNTVTCRYSGEWDALPRCLKGNDASLNLLNIVLPLLLIPLFVLMITLALRRRVCIKTKTEEYLNRTEEYDAFICYEYNEEDRNFAENIIRLELEENYDPPFKLFIHRRF